MESADHIEQLLNLIRQSDVFQKQELKEQLILMVNHLLLHDFNRLIQILYRMDVNEEKLKGLLKKEPGTDAAVIIAELIMERQQEKIKTREAFKSSDPVQDEEKW